MSEAARVVWRMEQGSLFARRYKWLDRNSDPVDLNDFTPRLTIREPDGTLVVEVAEDTLHIINRLDDGSFIIVFEPDEVQAAIASVGRQTYTGQPADAETFVLGDRTYTFASQANYTGAERQIEIGDSLSVTLENTVAVVNGDMPSDILSMARL